MDANAPPPTIDLAAILRRTQVQEVLERLDREPVGLAPVKRRIREITAFRVVWHARQSLGIEAQAASLPMSFAGNPGTGKTTVAMRMAEMRHGLGHVRKGHVVSVRRDDLAGQYIGHTAPKTKEVLKKTMGGVLFIDEADDLYRPENERDDGREAIEILLQVMENHRDDLAVILAGCGDRMATFFQSDPGTRSRIAYHIEFPDDTPDELLAITGATIAHQNYHLDDEAMATMREYIAHRVTQPHFANARSMPNAMDRARLRQTYRPFGVAMPGETTDAEALKTITAADIRASRVFARGADTGDH